MNLTVIRRSDVQDSPFTYYRREAVKRSMTPSSLLDQEEFPVPDPILPWELTSFDHLLARKEEIKNLALVPLKSDEMYKHYHTFTKEKLAAEVVEMLADQPMILAPNLYPYHLPEDVEQRIVWVSKLDTPFLRIVDFIGACAETLKLSVDLDLILFERSLKTSTKLVRGTLPQLRHVHFWSRAR